MMLFQPIYCAQRLMSPCQHTLQTPRPRECRQLLFIQPLLIMNTAPTESEQICTHLPFHSARKSSSTFQMLRGSNTDVCSGTSTSPSLARRCSTFHDDASAPAGNLPQLLRLLGMHPQNMLCFNCFTFAPCNFQQYFIQNVRSSIARGNIETVAVSSLTSCC
jgi:hypothetical protein